MSAAGYRVGDSHIDLLGDLDRLIDFHAKVAHGASANLVGVRSAWELPHASVNRTVRAGTSDPHRKPIKRAARGSHFRRQGPLRCRGPADRGWQSRLGAPAS